MKTVLETIDGKERQLHLKVIFQISTISLHNFNMWRYLI